MRRSAQGHVLAFIAACVLLTVWRGTFTNFVKPQMQWFLVIAGVAIALVAIAAMLGLGRRGRHTHPAMVATAPGAAEAPAEVAWASDRPDGGHGHGHDHSRGPWVGWLAVVPFLVMGVLAPQPLGAFSAERALKSQVQAVPAPVSMQVATTGDLHLTLGMFTAHTFDPARPLTGRTVVLTGFVTEAPEPTATGATWYLSRMSMGCCAADAYPIFIDPGPVDRPGPTGTWITVTGTWEPATGPDGHPVVPARLRPATITSASIPSNTYDVAQ